MKTKINIKETPAMENKPIYKLLAEQKKYFKTFRDIGVKNQRAIIENAVAFIRKELNYDVETGKCNRAVIGLSGGIDSAVTFALAVRAVGAENVIGVKMPDRNVSSKKSVEYADALIAKLKVRHSYEIEIGGAVMSHITGLRAAGYDVSDFVIGNIRARIRMVYLFAIANQENGRVLDTCNLTERDMGYFTKYGDGASDLNPIGELYKTWVWIIAKELGVPEKIIKSKPSAELMGADQTDEEDMGVGYSFLDLYLHLRRSGISKKEMTDSYMFPKEAVDMINATIAKNAHKNSMPPVCDAGF